MDASAFKEIEENANEGCGFVPEKVLDAWLGPKEGAEISAVVVRVVILALGVFKGVLVKKPGIDTIELPPSMKKVKTSKMPGEESWAYVLIHSRYPSATAKTLGRNLNPHLEDPSSERAT
jgi:hypothetical protein